MCSSDLVSAQNNICIGTETGKINKQGAENIIIGRQAGNNTSSDINYNIIFGSQGRIRTYDFCNLFKGCDCHFHITQYLTIY